MTSSAETMAVRSRQAPAIAPLLKNRDSRPMITSRMREPRHVLLKLAALSLCLPMLAMLGCRGASSGHAPGLAGGENLTPGITNFPLAYVKRPVPPATATASATNIPPTDIDVLDLITSTPGGD